MLTIDEKKAIIAYRRRKAYDTLNEAKEVAKLGYWSLAGNRLYYSVFHMASALLLDKGFTARTHSGVIHLIGAQFIAKGSLTRNMAGCSPVFLNYVNPAIMMICMMLRRKKCFLT